MVDVGAVARLFYEDPDSWRVTPEDDLHHPVGYRIRFAGGQIWVNGFLLGWWGRFALRRAVKARERHIVGAYLAKRASDQLAREQAEVDRIFAELDAHTGRE